jgi:hypothetical protein
MQARGGSGDPRLLSQLWAAFVTARNEPPPPPRPADAALEYLRALRRGEDVAALSAPDVEDSAMDDLADSLASDLRAGSDQRR